MDLPKRSLRERLSLPRARQAYPDDALEAAAANGGEGWIYHQDNARKEQADAVSISANTRTQVQIDGLGSESTDNLDTIPRPASGTPLLSSSKVMPVELNDNYLIRFGFTAAITDQTTEENNSIGIEFDVGGQFNVHETRTVFQPDPGPLRREQSNLTAISLGFTLIPPSLTLQITAIGLQLTAATSANGNGQKFITFGQAFAGSPVLSNGVAFYVTPTVDIDLWGADVTITRLDSPTT